MNTISFKITDVVIREKDSTCTVRVKRNDNNYTSILRDVSMSGLLINRIIKATAKKAGITREINTYLLRHTRLTEISKKGVKGTMHNLFSGHVKGSVQEAVYVHLDASDMRQELLDKVYRLDEPTEEQNDRYEERVRVLENQLREVIAYLRESRQVTTLAAKHCITGCSVEDSKSRWQLCLHGGEEQQGFGKGRLNGTDSIN